VGVRSIIAVLGSIVVIFFLSDALEVPTVAMLASTRPADMDAYLLARYEPAVLAGRAGIAAAVGVLGGYLAAKIAGQYEMRHAMVALALQTFVSIRAFEADASAVQVPLWVRLALVSVTSVAMVVGAAVRARAARLTSPTEVRS
jgi:hypothetical protein